MDRNTEGEERLIYIYILKNLYFKEAVTRAVANVTCRNHIHSYGTWHDQKKWSKSIVWNTPMKREGGGIKREIGIPQKHSLHISLSIKTRHIRYAPAPMHPECTAAITTWVPSAMRRTTKVKHIAISFIIFALYFSSIYTHTHTHTTDMCIKMNTDQAFGSFQLQKVNPEL